MEFENYDMRNEWIVKKRTGQVQEDIVSFIESVFCLYEIRRRVGECRGIVFEVRSNEGNHTIPHVHAKYGGFSISIAIDDGRILDGNLPHKQRKLATKWILDHREVLLNQWKNYCISATSVMTKSHLETSDE